MNYFKICRLMISLIVLIGINETVLSQEFVHPGLLHGTTDLARIEKSVAEKVEPCYSGYLIFEANEASKSDYKMQGPLAMVGRNPTIGQSVYDKDAAAAYQNALMWVITGQKAYADNAMKIINAWSATLKSITGRDAILMAGLGPFKMVSAAEIIRYTNAGWPAAEVRQAEQYFLTVVYPVIKDYAPFANGNWDSAALKTAMAIGVFCNNRPIFEDALRYYIDGAGDGSLFHYIINDTGQCQESGRDQAHTQLGLGHLADCSEIAWQQGLDLYSFGDNRLLKGFEYTAKYNLGLDVPYVIQIDQTGKYLNKQISTESRGRFRTVYEEVYNHYVNRKGLSAPYIQQVAEKIRPENQGSGGDNVGFGTLLFSRTKQLTVNIPTALPYPPAGLVAKTALKTGITLTWIPSVGATGYTVKRADAKTGKFLVLAKIKSGSQYFDRNVKNGTNYIYTVTAENDGGLSRDAFPVKITEDLPIPWQQATASDDQWNAAYDGTTFTLKSKDTASNTNHNFQAIYRPINDDSYITARYVPQISSQKSEFGLIMRDDLIAGSQVSLVIKPKTSKTPEEPKWEAELSVPRTSNPVHSNTAIIPIAPGGFITYGRLTGYCWLRLEKKKNEVTGYISEDGQQWNKVGKVSCSLQKKLSGGIVISSGNTDVLTTVKFDHVKIGSSYSK